MGCRMERKGGGVEEADTKRHLVEEKGGVGVQGGVLLLLQRQRPGLPVACAQPRVLAQLRAQHRRCQPCPLQSLPS